MGIKAKIAGALRNALGESYIRLEDDDGISGFVVSPRFKGVSSLDRQVMIDEAMKTAPDLSKADRRRVLMIAGLTPTEFDSAGARIRVRRIMPARGGRMRVVVQGGLPDAKHVRRVLKRQGGVRATMPRPSSAAQGSLMSFGIEGPDGAPLTREGVIQILGNDRYIEVMPGA